MKPRTKEDMFLDLWRALSEEAPNELQEQRTSIVRDLLHNELANHPSCSNYNLLVIHDETSMIKSDADRIYRAITAFSNKRPILLVLYSTGGDIGSAYLISKLCREYAQDKFVVVVPRRAKSGATLICCGADEIHMGSLSELGPIDPQIKGLPALGLKNAVEHIAELVAGQPRSAEMFAKYLHYSLEPIHLGHCERVAESAAQYAERLLKQHESALPSSAADIAKTLVYAYKDHDFVIDKVEASSIFGNQTVKANTPEYRLGNALYEVMSTIGLYCNVKKFRFFLVGSLTSECAIMKK